MTQRAKMKLLKEAIRQSDLDLNDKLLLRLGLRWPGVIDEIFEHIDELVGDVNSTADGEIIRIIIENLPAILEFVIALIGAFS